MRTTQIILPITQAIWGVITFLNGYPDVPLDPIDIKKDDNLTKFDHEFCDFERSYKDYKPTRPFRMFKKEKASQTESIEIANYTELMETINSQNETIHNQNQIIQAAETDMLTLHEGYQEAKSMINHRDNIISEQEEIITSLREQVNDNNIEIKELRDVSTQKPDEADLAIMNKSIEEILRIRKDDFDLEMENDRLEREHNKKVKKEKEAIFNIYLTEYQNNCTNILNTLDGLEEENDSVVSEAFATVNEKIEELKQSFRT